MIIELLLTSSALAIDPELVVTAAREPVSLDSTGGAITVIERTTIEALALPHLVDVLRLSPGVSISRSGPTGSQTQVRIRGAEANHTLVFVDGIEANDAASSGDFRWETLASDGIERIEVLRGPQSALWGSEAIGGVVAVTSLAPEPGTRVFGKVEAGSFETYHTTGGINVGSDRGGVVVQSSYYDTEGIDSFGGGIDERDGYHNFSVSLKAAFRPAPGRELGIVARHVNASDAFDGFDPATFQRADTADSTKIRSTALRGYGHVEALDGRWRHEVFGAFLTTDNINRNAGTYLNRADAETFHAGYQTSLDVMTGSAGHRITAAFEYRTQQYRADDDVFFGGTSQRQSRDRASFVVDYGLTAGRLALAASLRRDDNDSFADATTWRASARYGLTGGWSLHASGGKGVADPTFTEQFGFFPGSFAGNPGLTPERSAGWDFGIGYARAGIVADITWFSADLDNEIVSTFDPATFLSGVANSATESTRQGIEASFDAKPLGWLSIGAAYTWLDAEEASIPGSPRAREVRRARHSGSVYATTHAPSGELTFAANYVGKRDDDDFDSFPARRVSLHDYVLASLSGRVPIGGHVDLTARVENLFDASSEDVFGYRTQGISAFGGVRVRWGG